MNHLQKNQDAHRRLARGVQRFSRVYMKSAEFKARQIWLDFEDAVGTALQTISESVESFRAWFKNWEKPSKQEDQKSTQKAFPFMYQFFNSKS